MTAWALDILSFKSILMGKANHDADMQMKTLDGIELLKVRVRVRVRVGHPNPNPNPNPSPSPNLALSLALVPGPLEGVG